MKLIDRVEDHPFTAASGLHMLVSFNVYRDEVFDSFGEYEEFDIGEVEAWLCTWSAFGHHFYDEKPFDAYLGGAWEDANRKALIQIAMDIGQAKREKHDEEMAERRR